MIKKWLVSLLILFLNISSLSATLGNLKTQQIQVLSSPERKELESFFRMLFCKSVFPYTLFGEKPASFYDYLSKPFLSYFLTLPVEDWYMCRQEKNHLLFQKYRSIFNSENFLIVDQLFISNKFITSGLVRDFIIINKVKFYEVFNRHVNLFRERLGREMTAESLWNQFQSGRSILCDILKEDEVLWGVILGFGRHNAQLREQGDDIIEVFDNKYCIDQFPLPHMGCDPYHTETEQLKETYSNTQKLITEIYNSPNFLNIVLNRLHESQPYPFSS